jgi:hypothetical protein
LEVWEYGVSEGDKIDYWIMVDSRLGKGTEMHGGQEVWNMQVENSRSLFDNCCIRFMGTLVEEGGLSCTEVRKYGIYRWRNSRSLSTVVLGWTSLDV